jgi:hypothetical protein
MSESLQMMISDTIVALFLLWFFTCIAFITYRSCDYIYSILNDLLTLQQGPKCFDYISVVRYKFGSSESVYPMQETWYHHDTNVTTESYLKYLYDTFDPQQIFVNDTKTVYYMIYIHTSVPVHLLNDQTLLNCESVQCFPRGDISVLGFDKISNFIGWFKNENVSKTGKFYKFIDESTIVGNDHIMTYKRPLEFDGFEITDENKFDVHDFLFEQNYIDRSFDSGYFWNRRNAWSRVHKKITDELSCRDATKRMNEWNAKNVLSPLKKIIVNKIE